MFISDFHPGWQSHPPAAPLFSAFVIKTNNLESGCFPLEASLMSRKQVRDRRDSIENCEKSSPTQHSDFPAVINFALGLRSREENKNIFCQMKFTAAASGARPECKLDVVSASLSYKSSQKPINTHFNTKGLRGKPNLFQMFFFLCRYSISMSSWSLRPRKEDSKLLFSFIYASLLWGESEKCGSYWESMNFLSEPLEIDGIMQKDTSFAVY